MGKCGVIVINHTRPGPPTSLPFIFPTLLVTSQKVWVGGEKGLDKIEGVWYEQDG